MPPWSWHLTWNTQTVVIVVCVLAGILMVGCFLYILYDEPPEPKVDKRKPSSLPYATPPQHLTLGPRFAQIEAWKREQEAEKPVLAGARVFRLRATPPAASASSATDPTRATAPMEADWGSIRPRPRGAVTSSSSAPTAASEAANEVQPALHPIRLGTLAELAADRAAEPSWPTAEEAESEPAEGVEENRRTLHPVQLDWIPENFWEESTLEQEAVLPAAEAEKPLDKPPRLAPDLIKATPEADAVVPGSRASDGPAPHAPAQMPEAMPISVQAFGRAQLLVYGQPVEFRANQRLELVLYLAHQAAVPGAEREFLDRLIISDDLWPGMPREVSRQLERLRNCKSDLLSDMEKAGLSLKQFPWLETGPVQALRLHAAVPNTLVDFSSLVGQIAQTRAQAERGAPVVTLDQLDARQTQLQQIYQGGFALQFKSKPWLNKARRHYQTQFSQASFDLARLLARMGAMQQAIDLGTETILAANPSDDGIMRLVVEWVRRQESIEREAWASRFADEYERRYGRTLARAHEKMETLRQSVLPTW